MSDFMTVFLAVILGGVIKEVIMDVWHIKHFTPMIVVDKEGEDEDEV